MFTTQNEAIRNQIEAARKKNNNGMEALLMPNRTIQIVQNEKHNRIEMSILGGIDGPENYTNELQTLSSLSDQFDTLYITINSPGGAVSTLLQMYTAIKKFSFVITHATGQACSAGFFVWCMGDIRVVSPLTELMFHRESYGMYGKSANHEDFLKVTQRMGTELTLELTDGILTEQEMERGKSSEVYFLGKDLIDRGVAIDEDEFLEKDRSRVESMKVVVINNESFVQPDPSSPWVMPSGQTVDPSGEPPMMYHMASLVYLGSLEAVQRYDQTGRYRDMGDSDAEPDTKGITDLTTDDVEQMLVEMSEGHQDVLSIGETVKVTNINLETFGHRGVIIDIISFVDGKPHLIQVDLVGWGKTRLKASNVAITD